MSATLVRSTIWPTHVVALGPAQLAQLRADRALLSGRKSVATRSRDGSGANAGHVSRNRLALQRLGLMLRITTRGRNGRTLLYRPSSAGAPPRLASHRRTIARMLATPELLPEVAAQAAAPPAGLWECSGCGAVGPLPRPAACRFCSCAL